MERFPCVSLPFPSSHLPMVCIQLPESGTSKALSLQTSMFVCPGDFLSHWRLSTAHGGGVLGFPFFTLKPNSSRIQSFFLVYLLSCPAVGSLCFVLLLDLVFFSLEALCFLSQCGRVRKSEVLPLINHYLPRIGSRF